MGSSRGNLVNAGGCAGEFDGEALHADRSFDGSAVESAGEEHIGRRTLDGNVDRKAELVGAEIAGDDVGVAARAGQRAGKRAVSGHYEVYGGLFGPFWRGVGEFPFAGEVTLGRILGLFRLADGEFASLDEKEFVFCFFVADIAISDNQVADLPGFDAAEPVRDSQNFAGRSGQIT